VAQGLCERSPFDHINVVPISHNHIDHHSPASSVRFLLNNPKTVLVTTPEVRWQMERDSPEFKKIQSQVVVPDLDWKQSTTGSEWDQAGTGAPQARGRWAVQGNRMNSD
jgi:L-ascorbate metabolism protein UlaG (beta-lactamase superfamily)